MPSYLASVKDELKALFDDAHAQAWQEVIEPALKQSYRAGLEAGSTNKGQRSNHDSKSRRRRFGQRREPQQQEASSDE